MPSPTEDQARSQKTQRIVADGPTTTARMDGHKLQRQRKRAGRDPSGDPHGLGSRAANNRRISVRRPPLQPKCAHKTNAKDAPPRKGNQRRIPQVDVGEPKFVRSANVRIMTWNIDGFNDPSRRLMITTFLWENKVDIAVLTESHLLDEDIYKDPGDGKERIMLIQLSHYKIAHWYNRESTVNQRCGGVLVLARAGIDVTPIPQELLPARPLSCCSLIVEAIGGCSQPFRLTGVYLPPPPTARVTQQNISSLVADHPFCYLGGQRLNHILCGDFNSPSWPEIFEEWLSESGIWILSDPSTPTFPSGNALDRFLLLPGEEVWDAILPPSMKLADGAEGDFELEDSYYPAVVLP